MKASELLGETPYLHPGEMSRKMLDGGISVGAIKRDYRKLGQIQDLVVYIDNHNTHVIVIDLTSEVTTDRFEQVLRLQFKSSNLLKFKNNFANIIQVDKVSVLRKAGTQGIATTVYKMIVDSGFTLVSDITQFDPAKALWKKLAQDPVYKIYVADIDRGIFQDEDGIDIVYDGTNINEHDIWTSGSDMNGSYRVLIMLK
jgi:hypothetical protein